MKILIAATVGIAAGAAAALVLQAFQFQGFRAGYVVGSIIQIAYFTSLRIFERYE